MCCFVLKSISVFYEKNLKKHLCNKYPNDPKVQLMSITTSTALAASVGRIAGLARPALRSQLASLPFLSNKLKGPFWPLAEPCITREETLLW